MSICVIMIVIDTIVIELNVDVCYRKQRYVYMEARTKRQWSVTTLSGCNIYVIRPSIVWYCNIIIMSIVCILSFIFVRIDGRICGGKNPMTRGSGDRLHCDVSHIIIAFIDWSVHPFFFSLKDIIRYAERRKVRLRGFSRTKSDKITASASAVN
jgi:hypothetical protein